MKTIKCVKIEYIESGTYQGFEGDAYSAGHDDESECIAITEKDLKEIQEATKGQLEFKIQDS